jgi:lipoate-protein ligase A
MLLFDLTLPTPAGNVALDEALVEEAEAGGTACELLRFWESPAPLVVIGRSSRPEVEVHLAQCAGAGIPVIRRTSGGASIVTGPGCLMYALVLSYELRPQLKAIDVAHRFVLSRLVEALRPIVPSVAHHGTSDMTVRESANSATAVQKFSGNSLRVRRRHMLYHGTLLYNFDVALIERYLAHPPREPQYRAGRRHAEFIANLPVTSEQLRAAIAGAWGANEILVDWPRERTARLVADRYLRDDWNDRGK